MPLKGKDGVVKAGTAPTAVGQVQSWNLDIQAESRQTYSMGDEWQGAYAHVKSASGSAELYLPDAGVLSDLEAGKTVALELYPGGETDGTGYFTLSAVITANAISEAKDGEAMLTVNFLADGAVTQATVSGT
jgi:hypothetical protein